MIEHWQLDDVVLDVILLLYILQVHVSKIKLIRIIGSIF